MLIGRIRGLLAELDVHCTDGKGWRGAEEDKRGVEITEITTAAQSVTFSSVTGVICKLLIVA